MPWPDSAPCHSQPDGARPPLTQRPRQLAPVRSASASCRVLSRHLAHHSHCRAHRRPQKRLETAANFQSTRIQAPIIALVTPLPPSAVLAPSIGGFGLMQLFVGCRQPRVLLFKPRHQRDKLIPFQGGQAWGTAHSQSLNQHPALAATPLRATNPLINYATAQATPHGGNSSV